MSLLNVKIKIIYIKKKKSYWAICANRYWIFVLYTYTQPLFKYIIIYFVCYNFVYIRTQIVFKLYSFIYCAIYFLKFCFVYTCAQLRYSNCIHLLMCQCFKIKEFKPCINRTKLLCRWLKHILVMLILCKTQTLAGSFKKRIWM